MSGVFRDFGSRRRAILRSQEGAHRGICPACGAQRMVSPNAWHRRCRPVCACGEPLVPSARAQRLETDLRCAAPSHDGRRCRECGCKLRSGNLDVLCGPCSCKKEVLSGNV